MASSARAPAVTTITNRYHVLMHEGKLTKQQLQQWVLNRYYYQTRIPIKDAIIVSKSDDPAFRRM